MKRKPLLFLLLMTLFMPLVMNSQGLMKAPRGTALQAIGAQNSTRQETPQNRDGWLQYDDGNCLGGTGSSTAYYWTYASMYPASMLGNNNTLSQIAFYENTNMYVDYGVTIDIYSGGNDAPGNLIYSEDAALNGSTGMHVVELASPVTIDSSTYAPSSFMKLVAHVTVPSTGMRSPALTSTTSPRSMVAMGTSSMMACLVPSSAVFSPL